MTGAQRNMILEQITEQLTETLKSRVLALLGHRVETQNYIDDTGVQVADVVVAFRHLESKTLQDVEQMSQAPRFDYVCWDVYSKVATHYAAHPEDQHLRQDTLHEIEHGGEA